MPADASQSRPNLDAYRSNSSHRSQRHANETADSPSTALSSTLHKSKGPKAHVVGNRVHTRVPSYGKGLHKLTKAHDSNVPKAQRRAASPATSPETLSMKPAGSDGRILRNGSTTSLRKNSSHLTLKRNRSHVEVKRPRSAGQLKRSSSQPGVTTYQGTHKASVHFDLGNDGQDDAWTEASGSASVNLSRTNSVGASSGRSSAKPGASANNSQLHSPTVTHSEAKDWATARQGSVAPDAHQITTRLLQRTPSQNAPPQMSSISATVIPRRHSPDSFIKITATTNGTPRNNQDELVSRFVGNSSGASNRTSPTIHSPQTSDPKGDLNASRRAKSMGSLSRQTSPSSDEDERALAPRSRSRKSSADSHAYHPPQHSRTQQKLWLERASSSIEPQQMVPGAALNGITLPGLRPLLSASPLVGAGDDGRDPRIRLQLERTGLEYLVVRRYQDPVGRALKRLDSLPGAEKHRRIPTHPSRKGADGLGSGQSRYGLSQSLRETKIRLGNGISITSSGARSSYEPHSEGGSVGSERARPDDNEVSTILRSLWERNMDLVAGEE